MDIRFTGKSLKLTAGMKEHLEERLLKLEKYNPRLVEAHVFLKKEKYVFIAEITALAKGIRAFGKGNSKANIFTAMDEAYERVVKQLKKHRARAKDHHQNGIAPSLREARTIEMIESETALKTERPRIVSTKDFSPKPMSAEEASLQLEISENNFLVFLNSTTDRVNVLYRREDGDHGLIEPQF